MVPQRVIQLESLPLGSSGKIDRPALGRYLNVSRRSKRRSTKDLKRCVLEWMFQCGAGEQRSGRGEGANRYSTVDFDSSTVSFDCESGDDTR